MPLGDKLENQNPTLYVKTNERPVTESDYDDSVVDQFDQREIFGMYRPSVSKAGIKLFNL